MAQNQFLPILAGLTLSLSLMLSGCRADTPPDRSASAPSANAQPANEPQPAASISAPVRPTDTRPLVVCFGDSLTAGYGTEAGQSYPDYLQASLDARGYHYRVVNEGLSGNTTKDGLDRLNSILALKPAVTIVEFGGNDGLRGLRIEDTRANLDKIIATLKASGTQVIIAGITLPPDYGPDYIQQFTQTYVVLSKKYMLPLLPFLLKDVFGVPGMMQQDRTHATAAGNKIVASNILPLVTRQLKK